MAKGSTYYERNKAAISQRQKEYYAQNKERISARHRERYVKNREAELERSRERHKENKAREAETTRLYKLANKEKIQTYFNRPEIKQRKKEYSQAYYQENKDKWVMTREKKDRANELEKKRRNESEEQRIRHRQEATAWRINNPEKSKAIKIRKYGMTLEQFYELLKHQNGKCAICGMSDMSEPRVFPVVDHCHSLNHVRGLICSSCNRGLGFFKDSPALLRKAVKYIERNGLFGPIRKIEPGE